MGKGGRAKTQNGNNSSSSIALCNDNGKDQKKIFQSTEDKDKDDQISQPCNRCEDEISNLRTLNQILIKDINTSRQDFQTCFLHKVVEMESQIHILQAASTNFGSKMNNQFIQQVKIGEQLSDHLIEIDKEFRQEIAKRDEEYDAGISKAWQHLQEAEERFKREISEKEEYCRAVVSDKQTLETSVLQLTDKIEVAEQAWNADKENLFSSLGSTYEKKIEDMSALNQRVLLEKTELESQLNESKERTRALLEKLEDDRHLWVSEKQKLRGNVAELQTKIFSMATERGLLCQKNTALRAEAEYLKAQLNENIARVAQMQDERVVQQYRSENIELQSNLNDSKGKTGDLLKKIEEDTHLWDAEKSNLEGTVAELRAKHELMAREMGSLTQKNRELTVDAELIKNQVNALESELNESKKRSLELLQKSEEDWCLWDEKKSNLEGTLAELQTEHEDLMLKLSRKKALEEESRATMPPLEEMKESTSEGKMQIAELSSQFLAVAEEKDDQLSDIQRQLSAMAEEKKSQLATLQDQLSSIAEGKKILEDENKSLQTELDRRALVSEEVKVRLEGRVRELQKTLNSLTKELEYSRAIAGEKERQLVDLQNRHSKLVEAKNCLENKNDSLLTELNRCTMGSDENIRLQNRIRELETAVESLKQDIESKDNRLQKLMSESQNPWRKPLVAVVNGNGNPKRNGVLNENPKPKWCST